MSRILCACYGGGHVQLMIPLVKRLLEEGHQVTVLALTASMLEFQKAGIVHTTLAQYIPEEYKHEVIKYGEMLIGGLVLHKIPVEESLIYLGWSYWCLVQQYGEEDAWKMYEQNQRKAFLPLLAAQEVLTTVSPDLLLTTNSPRFERALVEVAGDLQLPSVCVVDMFEYFTREWLRKNNYASKVCVLCEAVKNSLISLGRSENDIIVTGNPSFDAIIQAQSLVDSSTIRKALKIPQENKVVLYLAQNEPVSVPGVDDAGDVDLPRKTVEKLQEYQNNKGNVSIIVRPHPNQDLTHIVNDAGLILSSQDQPLIDVLMIANVALSACSTAAMQAAVVGVPLIQLGYSIQSILAPFSEMNLAVNAKKIEDLCSVIDQALENDSELERFKVSSNATDNVLTVIYDLLNEGDKLI